MTFSGDESLLLDANASILMIDSPTFLIFHILIASSSWENVANTFESKGQNFIECFVLLCACKVSVGFVDWVLD